MTPSAILTRAEVRARLGEICRRGALLEEIARDVFRVTFASL